MLRRNGLATQEPTSARWLSQLDRQRHPLLHRFSLSERQPSCDALLGTEPDLELSDGFVVGTPRDPGIVVRSDCCPPLVVIQHVELDGRGELLRGQPVATTSSHVGEYVFHAITVRNRPDASRT